MEPYKVSNKWLSVKEYHDILLSVEGESCISKPPVTPNPGEIFVYCNEISIDDWKADQYAWNDNGLKHIPKESPVLSCHYYVNRTSKLFQKRAIHIFCNHKRYGTKTILHYMGSLKYVQPLPHGNRKHNLNSIFIRTAPSVLNYQKVNLKLTPQKVYKKQLLNTEVEIPDLESVMMPRDRNQVANSVYKQRNRKLLSGDDIVGLYLLDQEIKDFVRILILLKDFCAVLCTPQSAEHFNELTKSKNNILASYDTTFNLGDFYVSPLSYKHPHFNTEPVIPLAYLIHHRKSTTVHHIFFKVIRQLCPGLDGTVIVTDREKAINQAIADELPLSHNFFCWNHLQRDVLYWLKKQKNSQLDDTVTYTNHVWDLLDSESFEDFNIKYNSMKEHWTDTFKTYFKENIYDAVVASGKWALLKYDKYTPRSGITNNAAESLNKVLKSCMERKEVNLQVLTLTLYQLDLYYQKEITRGYCKLGTHKLKENFACLTQDIKNVDFIQTRIKIDDLPYVFFNKDFKPKSVDEEQPHTTFSVAKKIHLEGNVKLIEEQQAFIIKSLDHSNKYITTLYPQETCSCQSQRNCVHITAAKMAIGLDEQNQKRAKLSKLLRRRRGFRAGRKRTPKDLTVVEAADDSGVGTGNKYKDSILLPTSQGSKSIVKRRFVSPYNLNITNVFKHDKFPLASTPKKIRIETLIDPELSSITVSEKPVQIYGRALYPSSLKALVPDNIAKIEDCWLGDAILDIYLPSIIIEEERMNNSVKIYSVDSYVLNCYVHKKIRYVNGLREFVKYKIPEYDIILFPLTIGQHCRLFVLLKKQQMLIYLDSLGWPMLKEYANFILQLFNGYENYMGYEKTTFKIYAPKDIPCQENSVDCGAFVALFAETIIRRNNEDLKCYVKNMKKYRENIKSKLLYYLKHPFPGPVSSPFDENKLESHTVSVAEHSFSSSTNISGGTLRFLGGIVENYWDENSSICFLNTSMCDRDMPLVLCNKCQHWMHYGCAEIDESTVGERYVCRACLS